LPSPIQSGATDSAPSTLRTCSSLTARKRRGTRDENVLPREHGDIEVERFINIGCAGPGGRVKAELHEDEKDDKRDAAEVRFAERTLLCATFRQASGVFIVPRGFARRAARRARCAVETSDA
jgi:hypothetical protein